MPLWREFLRPEAYRPLGKNLLIRELLLSVNAGHCRLNFGQNMKKWQAYLDLGFSIITEANTTSDFKPTLYGTQLSCKTQDHWSAKYKMLR